MDTTPYMTSHQQNQLAVITSIEEQVKKNTLTFSTVTPVTDYANDNRICLTSLHFPHEELIRKIQQDIIDPLQQISPEHFYYPKDSLHMTIKNIRIANNPPQFNEKDIENAKNIFSEVIPKHKKFSVYFYRLLLFQNNLALIGTTDEELDNIIFDLDKNLRLANLVDDKHYVNDKYFFSNMTLVRFQKPLSENFKTKIQDIAKSMRFNPYIVDSVTLLTCNVACKQRKNIGTWDLQ